MGSTPETPPPPYYQRGNVTLYHGSCDAILPLLAEATFDLTFTSPPYNLGGKSNPDLRRKVGGRWGALKDGYGAHGDDLPEAHYRAWQVRLLAEVHRVSVEGASCFYNHKVRQRAGRMLHPMEWLLSEANPWTLRQEVIWDRGSTHSHDEVYFWPEDERVYWLTKGTPNLTDRPMGLSTIWRVKPAAGQEHPAPFPIELPSRVIHTLKPQAVLDPYAGSGTTLLAAKLAGARAVGIEIEERFCEMAAVRLSQETLPLFGEVA